MDLGQWAALTSDQRMMALLLDLSSSDAARAAAAAWLCAFDRARADGAEAHRSAAAALQRVVQTGGSAGSSVMLAGSHAARPPPRRQPSGARVCRPESDARAGWRSRGRADHN